MAVQRRQLDGVVGVLGRLVVRLETGGDEHIALGVVTTRTLVPYRWVSRSESSTSSSAA